MAQVESVSFRTISVAIIFWLGEVLSRLVPSQRSITRHAVHKQSSGSVGRLDGRALLRGVCIALNDYSEVAIVASVDASGVFFLRWTELYAALNSRSMPLMFRRIPAPHVTAPIQPPPLWHRCAGTAAASSSPTKPHSTPPP